MRAWPSLGTDFCYWQLGLQNSWLGRFPCSVVVHSARGAKGKQVPINSFSVLTICRHTWETMRTDLDFNTRTIEGRDSLWRITEQLFIEHGILLETDDIAERRRAKMLFVNMVHYKDLQKIDYLIKKSENDSDKHAALVQGRMLLVLDYNIWRLRDVITTTKRSLSETQRYLEQNEAQLRQLQSNIGVQYLQSKKAYLSGLEDKTKTSIASLESNVAEMDRQRTQLGIDEVSLGRLSANRPSTPESAFRRTASQGSAHHDHGQHNHHHNHGIRSRKGHHRHHHGAEGHESHTHTHCGIPHRTKGPSDPPTIYEGKSLLELLMGPKFGRAPLKGPLLCCGKRIHKNERVVNLDAVWAGVSASLSYFFAGFMTIWPYLLPFELQHCIGFSGLSSVAAIIAFGMFKGFQEMSWRDGFEKVFHGGVETGVLSLSAALSGGAAIGLVVLFDILPREKFSSWPTNGHFWV